MTWGLGVIHVTHSYHPLILILKKNPTNPHSKKKIPQILISKKKSQQKISIINEKQTLFTHPQYCSHFIVLK